MEKTLSEMSNEELWQLFPIILTEHKDYWKEYYKEEELSLKEILRSDIYRINHIGSTAIPGLVAKPTIDILLEIEEHTDTRHLIQVLEKAGYIYSPQPQKPAPHMMFMKGYTPKGFEKKVYHIHIRYAGDWDEVYFRDYLLSHPEDAKRYGMLKESLMTKYEYDRDAYTEAKSEFIQNIINKARKNI